MSPDTAQTDKTGHEASAQAVRAYEDAEVSECCAGSRTAPAGATAILRLITQGRCECDLCTSRHAKEGRQ